MPSVSIDLPQDPYTIHINPLGILDFGKQKVAVVTNPKISGLHLSYLLSRLKAKETFVVCIPDGESYKTLSTIEQILDNCFNHRLDRSSHMIAFGGGVIGDMAGFAANLYQRGIAFTQVPTTLLAQVDSSVGGKTGINNRFGKNLIGTFNQPKAVYIDTHFLKTLPKREYQAGIAEIIKMAVCFDKDFFEWIGQNDLYDLDTIVHAIERSVNIKAKVVIADEKEHTLRAKLNYGHTFGHVIENQTGYGTYLHGEAVAMGMVMANALAVHMDLLSHEEALCIQDRLKHYNLPTSYTIQDPQAFYDQFFLDKKTLSGRIKFILPKGIGDSLITSEATKDMVLEVLRTFQ